MVLVDSLIPIQTSLLEQQYLQNAQPLGSFNLTYGGRDLLEQTISAMHEWMRQVTRTQARPIPGV